MALNNNASNMFLKSILDFTFRFTRVCFLDKTDVIRFSVVHYMYIVTLNLHYETVTNSPLLHSKVAFGTDFTFSIKIARV